MFVWCLWSYLYSCILLWPSKLKFTTLLVYFKKECYTSYFSNDISNKTMQHFIYPRRQLVTVKAHNNTTTYYRNIHILQTDSSIHSARSCIHWHSVTFISHGRNSEGQPQSVSPACRYTESAIRWELERFSWQDMSVITKNFRHFRCVCLFYRNWRAAPMLFGKKHPKLKLKNI